MQCSCGPDNIIIIRSSLVNMSTTWIRPSRGSAFLFMHHYLWVCTCISTHSYACLSYHLEIINASIHPCCHLLPFLRGFRAGVQGGPKPVDGIQTHTLTLPLSISSIDKVMLFSKICVTLYPSQIFFTRFFSWSPWKKMMNTDLCTWSP